MFSNSIITNKIKNYFKMNISNIKKNEGITIQKKIDNSYNIGSLFNSRKDKIKDFPVNKNLISIFSNYINNKTKPLKYSYLNRENTFNQTTNNKHVKKYKTFNSQYYSNPKNIKSEILHLKKSYNKNNTIIPFLALPLNSIHLPLSKAIKKFDL